MTKQYGTVQQHKLPWHV